MSEELTLVDYVKISIVYLSNNPIAIIALLALCVVVLVWLFGFHGKRRGE